MHIECIGFFSVQLYILQRWQRLVSYLKLICSGNWSNHNTTCLFFVYLFWRGGVVLYIRFRYIGTLLLPFLIYIQLFTLLTKAFLVNRSQGFFSNMSLTIYSIACLLCEVQNMKSSCQVLEIHCCLITYKTDQYKYHWLVCVGCLIPYLLLYTDRYITCWLCCRREKFCPAIFFM